MGEDFERLRPLLTSAAFRILGSVADAQDAVQEAFIRSALSGSEPRSLRAFLVTVTTRVSIDLLRARRRHQYEYLDGRLDPLAPADLDHRQDPERSAELADTASTAALVLLERLTPLERAVFVLRELLEVGYDEIASSLGRSPAACRQLAVRARRHVAAGRTRFVADGGERRELAARLTGALGHGATEPLRRLLTVGVRIDIGRDGWRTPVHSGAAA